MTFLSSCRRHALPALVLSLAVLAPACADDTVVITPPKMDLSRNPEQPVYPDDAREKKEQGNSVLAIAVSAAGRVTGISLDTTSGFDDLDKAALAAARDWRFDAASDGHRDVAGVAKITVHFQLAPLPTPAVTETDVYALADEGDRIICRRLPPALGSNMSPPPTCAPKREWDEAAKRAKHAVPIDRPVQPFRPF